MRCDVMEFWYYLIASNKQTTWHSTMATQSWHNKFNVTNGMNAHEWTWSNSVEPPFIAFLHARSLPHTHKHTLTVCTRFFMENLFHWKSSIELLLFSKILNFVSWPGWFYCPLLLINKLHSNKREKCVSNFQPIPINYR